ncbi:MAG: hypothetical protein IJR85_08630 [Synergistaceae bacterium]|nr:hypothetical protein [Synergistaceae bacterium]
MDIIPVDYDLSSIINDPVTMIQTRANKKGGVTLRLLEMMGTSLKVESVYGEGSTFSFRLQPRVIKWEPLDGYEAVHRTSLLSMKKYKERFIALMPASFVAYDTQMNLTVFKDLLKRTLVKIDTADSGSEVLKLA